MELFKLFGTIMVDNTKANESIHKTDEKAEGLGNKFLSGIGTVAKWGTAIGAAAIAGATAIAGKATKAAMDFEQQMSNVATLLDGDVDTKIKNLGESVKTIAAETGASTELLTDGLYQTISAFGETEDAIKILETATKGAVAGNATVTDSINLLSAVTKGYGDTSKESAQKVSDLAFLTVKLGQTSFPELARSMGKVVPLAGTLKVSQEELFGAMATLTGVTGGTAEVSTQLRATLQGLMKPSAGMTEALKKLGYQNGAAALETLGLEGTLNALKGTVGGNETEFANLFSSVEAGTAVLALTGSQAENFTQKTQAMREAVGATDEAFGKQQDNIAAIMQKLKTNMDVVLISLGEQFLPLMEIVLSKLIEYMPQIQSALEVLFDVIGVIFSTIGNMLTDYIIPAFDLFFGSAIEGCGGFQGAMQTMADFITPLLNDLKGLFQAVLGVIVEYFKLHKEEILSITKSLFDAVKTIVETVMGTIRGIIQVITGLLKGDWEQVWNGLKLISESILNGIVKLVSDLLNIMINIIIMKKDTFLNAGKGIFNAIWDGMKEIWEKLSSWISDKVSWIADKLSFWKKSKSEMDDGGGSGGGGYDGSHANGLNYVPFDGYIAELHKGERVLTAEENKQYSNKNKPNITINQHIYAKVENERAMQREAERRFVEQIENLGYIG